MMKRLVMLLVAMMFINVKSSTAGTVRIRRNAFPQFGLRPIFASASSSATSFGPGSAFASASAASTASSTAFTSAPGATRSILSTNPFFNGAFNAGLGNSRFDAQGNRNGQFRNELLGNQQFIEINNKDNNRFGNHDSGSQYFNNIGTSGRMGINPIESSLSGSRSPSGSQQTGLSHPFGSNSRAPPGFGFQAGYAAQNPDP